MRTMCHKMLTCNIYALLLVCCCCSCCAAAAAAAAAFATASPSRAAANSQQHNHYRVRHQHQQHRHHLLRQTTKTTTSLPAARNRNMRPELLALPGSPPTPTPASSSSLLLKLTPVQYFTAPTTTTSSSSSRSSNGRTRSSANDNRIHLADAENQADEWNGSKHDRAAKRLHDQQQRHLWHKHHNLHPNFAHSHLHHRKHHQDYRHPALPLRPHSTDFEDGEEDVDDGDDDDNEYEDAGDDENDASQQHHSGTDVGRRSGAHHLINLQQDGSSSSRIRSSLWSSSSTVTTETTAINSPELTPSRIEAAESLRVGGGQRASHFSLSPERPMANNGDNGRAGERDGNDWNWSWDSIGDKNIPHVHVKGDNNVSGAKKVHLNVDVDDDDEDDGDASFTTQKPSVPDSHSATTVSAGNDITSSTSSGIRLPTPEPERFVPQMSATSGNKFKQILLNDSTAAPPLMSLLRQLQTGGGARYFSLSQATEHASSGSNELADVADKNRSSHIGNETATETTSVGDDADDFDDNYDDPVEGYVVPVLSSNVLVPVYELDDDLESVDQNEVKAGYSSHRERPASEEVDMRKVPYDYDSVDYPSDTHSAQPGDMTAIKLDTLGTEAAVNRSRSEYFADRSRPEAWDNRTRIDWLLGNLTSAELNDRAHAHMSRIRRCMRPMSRIFHLNGTDPRLRYLPHCIELHRCSNDAGCCGQDDMSCVASKTEEVFLYFLTMHVTNNRLNGYDIRSFINHTECRCMPNGIAEPSALMSTAARSAAPNCVCVQHYEVFNDTQINANGQQSECYCGCRDDNEHCRELSNGRQEFPVADRMCVRTSKCRRPFCEHGSYNMTSGSCPTVEQKRIRALYHNRG